MRTDAGGLSRASSGDGCEALRSGERLIRRESSRDQRKPCADPAVVIRSSSEEHSVILLKKSGERFSPSAVSA